MSSMIDSKLGAKISSCSEWCTFMKDHECLQLFLYHIRKENVPMESCLKCPRCKSMLKNKKLLLKNIDSIDNLDYEKLCISVIDKLKSLECPNKILFCKCSRCDSSIGCILLQYIDRKYICDIDYKKICLRMVHDYPLSLRYIKDPGREICIQAIKSCRYHLHCQSSKEIRDGLWNETYEYYIRDAAKDFFTEKELEIIRCNQWIDRYILDDFKTPYEIFILNNIDEESEEESEDEDSINTALASYQTNVKNRSHREKINLTRCREYVQLFKKQVKKSGLMLSKIELNYVNVYDYIRICTIA